MIRLCKWLIVSLVLLFSGYVNAQNSVVFGQETSIIDTIFPSYVQINDSTFLFNYKPGDNDLYAAVNGNAAEVKRVAKQLEQYEKFIKEGSKVILVRSFSYSEPSVAENKKMAYWLSYRSKSWLILKNGMKEEYFRTKNRSVKSIYDNYNKTVMVVVNVESANKYDEHYFKEIINTPVEKFKDTIPVVIPIDTLPNLTNNITVVDSLTETFVVDTVTEQPDICIDTKVIPDFAIKTNTLYWFALAPNAEIEWFIPSARKHWSLSAEGIIAWWRKKPKEKTYQIQQYGLEGRYWFNGNGEFKNHFVGLYANGGIYDLGRNMKSGNRGEFCGAGLSYGYALPIKGSFRMEFQLGLGYIKSWFERYVPVDGHHVYKSTHSAKYIGPTKVKVSLGWILNNKRAQ